LILFVTFIGTPLETKGHEKVFILSLLLILCLAAINPYVYAQYYAVTDTAGTHNIGGVNVTVVPIGYRDTAHVCGIGPFSGRVAQSIINYPGGYKYIFSSRVNNIRVHFDAINPGDTMTLYLNGNHYNITSANLSSLYNSCSQSNYTIAIVNGNLGGSNINDNYIQLDIYTIFAIDSIEIDESSVLAMDFNGILISTNAREMCC